MSLEIWAGGQTGVDLGAYLAALEAGVSIGGFMPADGHNEAGPIPDAVAMHLRRHDRTNPAARTMANVAHADAAIVIVPDRRRAGATRGTALTIRLCKERIQRKEWQPGALVVLDPTWSDLLVGALAQCMRERRWECTGRLSPFRLLVAGPRASLWPDGEREARRFVGAICKAVQS